MLRYPVHLEGYLPDLSGGKLTLELQFKNVNRYFLSQLNGLTIPSIIFLLIIIIVILWVYRSFHLQKNLITSTNEFINNLTHELKTPVFSIGVGEKIGILRCRGIQECRMHLRTLPPRDPNQLQMCPRLARLGAPYERWPRRCYQPETRRHSLATCLIIGAYTCNLLLE